jgi:hypothetical protein
MINLQATRVLKTSYAPKAAGVFITEEGQALVSVKEDGIRVVRPSTGAQDEQFAGFRLSRAVPPQYVPKVEEFKISKRDGAAVATFEAIRVPVAGKLLVRIGDAVVTDIGADAAAPDAAGKVNRVKDTFYFHDADLGKPAEIQYHYEPTVTEAQQITGDAPHGGHPGNAQNQESFLVVGDIATSHFDSSVDWTGVLNPRLGPDGILTTAGQGTLLKNVTVLNSPSAEGEFLLLEVHAY